LTALLLRHISSAADSCMYGTLFASGLPSNSAQPASAVQGCCILPASYPNQREMEVDISHPVSQGSCRAAIRVGVVHLVRGILPGALAWQLQLQLEYDKRPTRGEPDASSNSRQCRDDHARVGTVASLWLGLRFGTIPQRPIDGAHGNTFITGRAVEPRVDQWHAT
jgi:hypothetical protein